MLVPEAPLIDAGIRYILIFSTTLKVFPSSRRVIVPEPRAPAYLPVPPMIA